MPNWCSSNLTLTAKPEDLDKIENALNSALSKRVLPDEPQYFDNTWLGNLLAYTGMSREEVEKTDISCRGTIDDVSRYEDSIVLYISSAWSPQFGALKVFLDYLDVHPEIIYIAEEFGSDIYVTNDPDYVDTFYLSTDKDNWYDLTEQDFRETLVEQYGEHEEFHNLPIDKLIEWALYEFEDVCIHKCEYADFDEWL